MSRVADDYRAVAGELLDRLGDLRLKVTKSGRYVRFRGLPDPPNRRARDTSGPRATACGAPHGRSSWTPVVGRVSGLRSATRRIMGRLQRAGGPGRPPHQRRTPDRPNGVPGYRSLGRLGEVPMTACDPWESKRRGPVVRAPAFERLGDSLVVGRGLPLAAGPRRGRGQQQDADKEAGKDKEDKPDSAGGSTCGSTKGGGRRRGDVRLARGRLDGACRRGARTFGRAQRSDSARGRSEGLGLLKKQLFAAVHGGEVGGEVGGGWLTTTISLSPPQAATALLYVSPGKLTLQ